MPRSRIERKVGLEKHSIEAVRNRLRGRSDSSYDRLLLNNRGKPISERGVRHLAVKYTGRAGLAKHATLQTLRHTFASAKSRRGVLLRRVQE